MNTHLDDHDLGLAHDMQQISLRMAKRRRLLGMLMAGSAVVLLPACSGEESTDTGSTDTGSTGSIGTGTSTGTSTGTGSTSTCEAHPTETNGPYPSDGSNSVNGSVSNVLLSSGVVRSDIRSSFGISGNTAAGVPLTLNIRIVRSSPACAPLSGHALYLWHCTADGLYSLYSSGVHNENFLRGVQVSDSNGLLTFTTVFPGCYDGRYPHFHFEVFSSLAAATNYNNRVLVSQMALPRNVCSVVYSSASGYGNSNSNLARVSLATDGIFANNTAAQVAAQTPVLSGDISSGFTGEITVGLA